MTDLRMSTQREASTGSSVGGQPSGKSTQLALKVPLIGTPLRSGIDCLCGNSRLK